MRAAIFLLSLLTCSATDLEHRIDAMVESSRALVGIQVVDSATGNVLYHRNEDKLFLPASNMKLFTSALALLRLGTDYHFETRVVVDASGNLVLIGSGDPSLSGRVYPYQKGGPKNPRLQAIEDLATQIVANGVNRIDGDVIGDDRLYPWAPFPPSWTQDDTIEEFGAPVSALTVNDNAVAIAVHPGAQSGDSAEISLQPALEYYSIDNRINTVAHGGEAKIRISRQPGGRQILLWGSIPAGHGAIVIETPIDDPALYAATALYDALTRRGVAITGHPAAHHRAVTEDDEPVTGNVVATRTSPPLEHILQVLSKVSQNLHAELILREIARVSRHTGTREAGLEELSAMMTEIGSPAGDTHFEDGSGLSRNTIVTPRSLTRLLAFMNGSKYHDAWQSILPVGGEDGTLEHRFVKEGHGILAKTGSLSRALALSGYADSKSNGRVAFSILVNDFPGRQVEVRTWIDKIAAMLLE